MQGPYGLVYRPRTPGHRRCLRCDRTLPGDAKNFPPRADGRRPTYCRDCVGKVKFRLRCSRAVREFSGGATGSAVTYVRSFKSRPCADCGLRFHSVSMQFDHVRGEKKFNLSNLTRRTLAECVEEIAKCDVVCANCHTVRTWNRTRRHGAPPAPFGPLNDAPPQRLDAEDTLHP